MDKNSEKEVFTNEELLELNEKLKNTENIELPESLKAENIADALNNEAMWKPEQEKKIKDRNKERLKKLGRTS